MRIDVEWQYFECAVDAWLRPVIIITGDSEIFYIAKSAQAHIAHTSKRTFPEKISMNFVALRTTANGPFHTTHRKGEIVH